MPDHDRWPSGGGDPSLNEINRIDRFIDALATNQTAYSTDREEAELAFLLADWRDGVRDAPLAAMVTPREAANQLNQTLRTILAYIQNYPDYEGFLPWVDIRPNGTIAPATTKVPSLDNGQMTWALAAVVAAFEDSNNPELRSCPCASPSKWIFWNA